MSSRRAPASVSPTVAARAQEVAIADEHTAPQDSRPGRLSPITRKISSLEQWVRNLRARKSFLELQKNFYDLQLGA